MTESVRLLQIANRMKEEQLSKKELLATGNSVNVSDEVVGSLPRLFYNHCLNKTKLRKFTSFGTNTFQDLIQDAINKGIITEPVFHNKQHLFTRHDIARLWEHFGFSSYRDEHVPRAIAVENQKGGTGKSTTTATLATATALDITTNAKVLIIEIDPQGSNGQGMINQATVESDAIYLTPIDLTLGMYEPDSEFQDLIDDGYSEEEIILASPFNTHLPNLDVMPAFSTDERFLHQFWKADDDMKDEFICRFRRDIMPVLKSKYDIIYIDTPPQESPLLWLVNEAIDCLLIPITPREYDYASTVNYSLTTSRRFESLPSKGSNLIWSRFLVVNHNEKSNTELSTVSKLTRTVQDRLLSSCIIHSELISYASSMNRTALDVAKQEKVCSGAKYDEAIASINQTYKQIIREIKTISIKETL
ncbi:ParA family protein [Vibrio sp.]|uniref:ParA family protein n=1 Tax=Vibrio sp. TaxID=678 RepID=UPI003F6D17D9